MTLSALLPLFVAVTALIALVVAALALLQRLTGRCLQGGTCGSKISCAGCPKRRSD